MKFSSSNTLSASSRAKRGNTFYVFGDMIGSTNDVAPLSLDLARRGLDEVIKSLHFKKSLLQ